MAMMHCFSQLSVVRPVSPDSTSFLDFPREGKKCTSNVFLLHVEKTFGYFGFRKIRLSFIRRFRRLPQILKRGNQSIADTTGAC